jgi:hypothetical protein
MKWGSQADLQSVFETLFGIVILTKYKCKYFHGFM